MNISFELTAHARFVNSGGTRWCWKPSNEYVQLDFGSRSTFLIRDEDDIKSLRSDSYGLPTVSNFPLVDALMLPDIGIQMTISKSHDVSVNSLPKILKILGIDESAFKMVFVVPKEGLPAFNFPKNLGAVQMYLTIPGGVSEEEFKNLCERNRLKRRRNHI